MLLERLALFFCALCLFVMMAVGAVDILLDEIFSRPIAFKVDLSTVMLAASVFLAWPLVQRKNEHIRVQLLERVLPKPVKAAAHLLSLLAALTVFGLIAYGSWNLAIGSIEIMEESPATLGFPIWPAKLACAIGVSLTLLTILLQLVTDPLGFKERDESKSGLGID